MSDYRDCLFVGGPNDGKTIRACIYRKVVFPWMIARSSVTFPNDGIFRTISICECEYAPKRRVDDGSTEFHYSGLISRPWVQRFAGIDEYGLGVYVNEMTLEEWDKLHPPQPDEVWPWKFEKASP